MGAVEHLKTMCCLGLPPESAMVALTPLMHEIIPHGWTRFGLLAPDATVTSSYAENPAMGPVFRERLWRFMDDPTALVQHPTPWASAGPCIGKVASTWKAAIIEKFRRRSTHAGSWAP